MSVALVIVHVVKVVEPRTAITPGPSPIETRMSGTTTGPGGDGQRGLGSSNWQQSPGSTTGAVGSGDSAGTRGPALGVAVDEVLGTGDGSAVAAQPAISAVSAIDTRSLEVRAIRRLAIRFTPSLPATIGRPSVPRRRGPGDVTNTGPNPSVRLRDAEPAAARTGPPAHDRVGSGPACLGAACRAGPGRSTGPRLRPPRRSRSGRISGSPRSRGPERRPRS